ncbi:hypothetical protein CJ430_30210 [Klebsiella pneumoniae]|nr:hypothetical protein CJ430_30210 [Klebsiella pneumoniae]
MIFSAESWPCFQIEPAQADNQGLRVNVLTMIVYPALLFAASNPLRVFAPDLQNDRAATFGTP